MTERTRAPATRLLFFLAASALLAMVLACGANHRERTIKTTLSAVNTVRDDFIALDGKAQLAIVEAATTREEGASRLASYRAKRDVIVQGFATVYRAIAIAATATDGPSVESMVSAARQLKALVEALRKDLGT